MFEVLSTDEMQRAETATITGEMTGFALMTTAGHAVAAQIGERIEPCTVLVLCGAGNNGGDGFITAHTLKKKGWNVRIACTVKTTALKGDAAKAAKLWDDKVETLNSNLNLKDTQLVVDAIFGTGFRDDLDPELVTLFDKIRTRKIPVVAVDVPSGIDATTCTVDTGTLQADLTITFCRKKIAHLLYPSKKICGKVITAQIGISDETVVDLQSQTFENNPALWLNNYPIPAAEDHKYKRGHVVVYGGALRTGAACLAAHAAQRGGAGLVTILCKPETHLLYASYRASLMVDTWTDIESFKTILRDERKNVCIIGPGAGDGVAEITDAALTFNKTCILDGDVFTAFKDSPKSLFEKLSPQHILTPHAGEFERLFGHLDGSKLERARSAAKTANAIIVFKGPDTIIAAPDGTAIINTNARPILATAGSGDVLSGLIAGLVAQGMPPFMAAAAGVWLHGETSKKLGLGITAEDVIYIIPQILSSLFPASNNIP